MGCSGGCDKVRTEDHNKQLAEQREQILTEQEAITNNLLQSERSRLEKEVEDKFNAERLRLRKEYEENATSGAEIFANNKLKAYMNKELQIEQEVSKRFDQRVEEIRKVGCVVRPILFNECEEITKT